MDFWDGLKLFNEALGAVVFTMMGFAGFKILRDNGKRRKG